jgi:integrase
VDFYRSQDKEDVPTLKEVYLQWREYHWKLNNSSNGTKDKYITDYFRYIHDKPIESMHISDITDMDLENFFVDTILAEGIDYRTFGKLFGYFDGTFKYAFKHRMIKANPMLYLEKKEFRNTCTPKKQKTAESELIPDEAFDLLMEQLYQDMQDNPTNFTYYGVELAAKTAMRVGELATLKWEDINYKDGYILIRRSDKLNKVRDESGKVVKSYWSIGETKTKKNRRFPIDDSIRQSLDRIRKAQFEHDMVSEWVFPHPVYGWTHSLMIASCAKNKGKQLGFPFTVCIHKLRKTLNSDLRNNNASSKMCASMIGHTPEVNDDYYYYDNTDMEEKRKAIEKAHKKRHFA